MYHQGLAPTVRPDMFQTVCKGFQQITKVATSRQILTLKAPITTTADDKFCDIFPNF